MPPIVKRVVPGQVTPVVPRQLADDPFDRIIDVKDVESRGTKLVIFGDSKSGKSRLMSKFPKPLLIIGGEDGTETIRNVPGVSFIQVMLRSVWQKSMDEGKKVIGHVVFLDELPDFTYRAMTSRFASIGVDTGTALQDLILADVLGLEKPPEQKSFGVAGREEWGLVANRFKTILGWLFDSDKHVIVTCQEKSFRDEKEKESLGVPYVGGALTGGSWLWLKARADYVCQTFRRGRTQRTFMEMPDGSKQEVSTPLPGMDFCLRIAPNSMYQTGFRNIGDGNDLPESVVNADFTTIQAIIKGEYKP